MGMAMAQWQRVEVAHFLLFRKLLAAPRRDIASIVYHSTESFDARRVMVDRMAQLSLTIKRDREEWPRLHKAMKDASLNRNKIAHYSIEYSAVPITLADGTPALSFPKPSLQSHPDNVVNRLLGRSSNKDGHKLSVPELQGYIDEFYNLGTWITNFALRLKVAPPQPTEALAQSVGHAGETLTEVLQSLLPDPPDTEPSGQ